MDILLSNQPITRINILKESAHLEPPVSISCLNFKSWEIDGKETLTGSTFFNHAIRRKRSVKVKKRNFLEVNFYFLFLSLFYL